MTTQAACLVRVEGWHGVRKGHGADTMPELTHYDLFGYASAAMLVAITIIEIAIARIGRDAETTFSPRPSCLARDVPAQPSAREETCA